MATKQKKLEELRQNIVHDNICPELAAQATQLVFGTGNPDADIIFIGEAPGKKEDEQGEPFVGASGKFLDEMLAQINLGRGNVYITNIVKYRPPNNRDPLPDEKRVFLPYLQSQLEIIQPKILVTLGRHSLNCFLPDLTIGKCHGQPKRVKLSLKERSGDIIEVIILPLFHPAAALYNGSMRQTVIDDFMNVPIIINEISKNKPKEALTNE